MTEPHRDPEEPKGDDAGPSVDLAAAPASTPTIGEDTSRGSIDQDKLRTEDFMTAEASTAQGLLFGIQKREIHAGPLPSPRTLRELKEIYEDAPKLVFEEFRAQSAHRRKMEEAVIATKNKLAIRGQVIGGILGGIGLIGSLVVAGLGQGLPLLG